MNKSNEWQKQNKYNQSLNKPDGDKKLIHKPKTGHSIVLKLFLQNTK